MEATRSLDDSNFGAISRRSGTFAADGLSSTRTGHTLEPAMPFPVSSKRCFCRGFVSIEGQQLLRPVGLHLSTPPFHHTPWGLLSWQLDRTAITATSGYGVLCGLPGAPCQPFLRPRCLAATHPRVVWCGPGQPTHLTVSRHWKQGELRGKEIRRRSVCM